MLREPDPLLPLRAGLAVADLAGAAARVKWPNDVLVDGRKVAGILVEGRPQEGWAVLGIGVNAAVALADLPDELRATAGTLGLAPAQLPEALARLLAALEQRLSEPVTEFHAAFRERDALLGATLRWNGGTGTGAGITDAGALRVRVRRRGGADARFRRGPPDLRRRRRGRPVRSPRRARPV